MDKTWFADLMFQIPAGESEMPSSVTGNYTQIKDPLLIPQQPIHQHGNTLATSHTDAVTTTTSIEQPRLSLPPVASIVDSQTQNIVVQMVRVLYFHSNLIYITWSY